MSKPKPKPKHGGQILELGDRVAELSVFETGQPPRFRLHFFGAGEETPPPELAAEIETIRPDGTKQTFALAKRGAYLESTSDIPEPHEFRLVIAFTSGNKRATKELQFTEDDHGHGHHAEHGHGGGHGHGHSHGTVDATIFTSERGLWATRWSFIALFITASAQLVVVLLSHSVALMADMIHNFGDATTAIPLTIAFVLAKRSPSRRFTYGLGRVEDLAGLAVVMMILASAIVAGYVAIDRLVHPHDVGQLGAVMIASVIGFLGNEGVAIFRIKVGKEINSAALIADGYHARTDGWTSLAVLVGAVGVHFGYPIADPIIGLVITVAILGVVWQSVRAVFTRMLDGIEPEMLAKIRETAAAVPGIAEVGEIRARWLGHRVHAEVTVSVGADLTVSQAHALAEAVEHALKESHPVISGASIHTHPVEASASSRPPDPPTVKTVATPVVTP